MQERIIDIILYLVNELRSNKKLNEVDISSLMQHGYTQGEISTACSWISERMGVLHNVIPPMPAGETSHRQLNTAERMIIRPDAFGYLLQCCQLGLLNNDEIEAIIDRIMGAGMPVLELDDMKSVVAGFVFDPERTDRLILFGSNNTIH